MCAAVWMRVGTRGHRLLCGAVHVAACLAECVASCAYVRLGMGAFSFGLLCFLREARCLVCRCVGVWIVAVFYLGRLRGFCPDAERCCSTAD